jgi:4-carboxymuconolactone decarboxylase
MMATRHLCVAATLVALTRLAASTDAQQPSAAASQAISITQREVLTAPTTPPAQEPQAGGGAGNFTGAVRVRPVFQAIAPGRAAGADVAFAPGARTVWHMHPAGQTLIVVAGVGRVQQRGSAPEEIRPGDVVHIPPNVKHWHGASPDSAMTHLAITEPLDGRSVEWMEPVSDDQYRAPVRARGNGVTELPHVTPSTGQLATQPPREQRAPVQPRPSGPVQDRLAPGMAEYTNAVLFGDVWRRPQLSPRDRSLVTIAVLIATGKPAQLQGHLGRALANGVQPREASGVLTHLAIYCGWPSAVAALDVYDQVYAARNIDTAGLRASVAPLPPDAWNAERARATTEQFGTVAPKFTQLTNDLVFDNLWRRADLSVRDRSLVTISALAAMGDDDLLDFYLRRAVESGLTRDQIAEAFTHLAFYAGWTKATKAMTATARTLSVTATPR